MDSLEPFSAALIRPAKHNRNLQVLAWEVGRLWPGNSAGYYEVDGDLRIGRADEDRSEEVEQIASVKQEFTVDAASVIATLGGARYRLPKAAAAYDQPFATGWPRCVRECVSERYLVNAHGTFYEMPRDEGLPLIGRSARTTGRILDFCTWRGLMVLSGVRAGAKPMGTSSAPRMAGWPFWFGHIDDLWQRRKPAGKGGSWLQTPASPEEPSDPYLMTGYDRKQLISRTMPRPR